MVSVPDDMAVTPTVTVNMPEESPDDTDFIPSPTFTSTPVPTNTPAPTASPSPTVTPTPTSTPSPTPSPSPTPTPTPTEIPVYDKILMWEAENKTDPEIPVKSALLMNLSNDEVLYSENATKVIYPASITKLMTAYMVFSAGADLTQTVGISKTAVTPVIPSAKMSGLKAGDRIRLADLIACMLINSGNDTSVAVGEHLFGSELELVALMNQKAEELGMSSSYFCNSHGLPDDNHVTSAHDIYLIMQKLFYFEEFLDIIELGSIKADVLRGESLKTLSFSSTNQFLKGKYKLPEGIELIGGKSGTTKKAGYCLTMYVKDQDGNCYIAEIFGAETYEGLYLSMAQLLTHISH